mgnify:CR=1 FL=1
MLPTVPGDLAEGLYEALVTRGLARRLDAFDPRTIERRPVQRAEVANRFALHLAQVIERSLAGVADAEGAKRLGSRKPRPIGAPARRDGPWLCPSGFGTRMRRR